MSTRYTTKSDYTILKTTKLYSDGKTQVPQQVIKLLNLKKGEPIVWIQEKDRIYVAPPTFK